MNSAMNQIKVIKENIMISHLFLKINLEGNAKWSLYSILITYHELQNTAIQRCRWTIHCDIDCASRL